MAVPELHALVAPRVGPVSPVACSVCGELKARVTSVRTPEELKPVLAAMLTRKEFGHPDDPRSP
ncbi:hypothetical protein AB0910_10060 [Streptomyces sp. NPDC047002]|uniref:hypothetical protein n=1 Tax=Streptomyces sp. NPDC047002 TaxID=3155475 RepID=UPI003452A685